MANKNDARILELRKQIEEKKEKIGKINRFVAVTNCSIELNGVRININTLDKEKLVSLAVKINAYLQSAKDLGLEKEFYISGYLAEDWITDIKAKLEILSKKDELKELTLMEVKLEKLLSDEKQVELEIDTIANLLKD